MTGPVQVIVLGFDEPSFTGEVMAELTRLREAGVVRVVDVLLVSRDEDGTFETLPAPPGTDPDLGRIAADVVAPGSVAAVALVEHLWAQPLVEAIRDAGGRPLAEAWLSPEDRNGLPEQSG